MCTRNRNTHIYIYIYIPVAPCARAAREPRYARKHQTCHFRKNVQLPRLRKDLRMVSISRDTVNFPSELCRRRSGMFGSGTFGAA